MGAALEVSKLRFSYSKSSAEVLRGVNLSVAPGEMVALVGPNGGGKTTLIKCAAGLLAPTAGEIRYGGRSLAGLNSRERAVKRAYAPQGADYPFPYSVEDAVLMGLAHQSPLYLQPRDPAPAREVLDELGYDCDQGHRADTLSGGQKQLVVVARALIQASPLLLLDEPTSALDLRHKAQVIKALRKRAAAGIAVLVSLHDLNLAASVCDRLVVIDAGEVGADGTPAEVLTQERLTSLYGPGVICEKHPTLGTPLVALDPKV